MLHSEANVLGVNKMSMFPSLDHIEDPYYVYLAKSSESRYTKIGKSNRPIIRMSSIQTGTAGVISLTHAVKMAKKDCYEFEKLLHKLFEEKRVKGEWFDLDDEDIGLIMCKTAEHKNMLFPVDYHWNEKYNCNFSGMRIIAHNEIELYFRWFDYCKKKDCIRLAKDFLPCVKVIRTFSGPMPDADYVLTKKGWVEDL